MNKQTYKECRRIRRIALRLAEELWLDQMIYETSFQLQDDCGIFNIPPEETVIKDGKPTWSLLP